jgi:2'-5' RNA ligase
MRLFVAVTPPPEALRALRLTLAPMLDGWDRLRWSREESWHITLAFLGEVDASLVPQLSRRLARVAARHSPMELSIRGAGAFSRPAAARVVWSGIAGPDTDLRRLADSVAAAARRAGITVEERRFRAHLTVARCKQPTDVRPLVTELAAMAGPPWRADAIHLIRSHLGPKAYYETLRTWQLTGKPPHGRED